MVYLVTDTIININEVLSIYTTWIHIAHIILQKSTCKLNTVITKSTTITPVYKGNPKETEKVAIVRQKVFLGWFYYT